MEPENRLRVLQVAVEPGPATALVERLAVAFAAPTWRAAVEQQIVLMHRHPLVERLRHAGAAVVELPFRTLFDRHTSRALSTLEQTLQPDVVLLWDRRALSRYPGADATRVGVLSDYAGFGHWRRCRHLLALSEDLVQAACERGWPPERVERAPLFLPDEPVPASSPGALAGWTNKDLVLATPFAAGDPGARLLLEAVAPMPSICLWIPAAQRDHRRLRAAIARAGMAERAVLLAPEQVSAGLYAAADLVVAAGQQDDIGLGVVQAWAAGKPVVGAGGLGPAALIRHGDNGFLCSRGNATALRSALLRLLDDPLRCDRLALAGRRTFLQHHREARGVESWFDALRKAHHIPDARDAAHAPVHWSVRA